MPSGRQEAPQAVGRGSRSGAGGVADGSTSDRQRMASWLRTKMERVREEEKQLGI
jgi:hypothetical protein